MLLRLFRQGTTGKQRFSQLFWMFQRGPIFNLLDREPGQLETRLLNDARLPSMRWTASITPHCAFAQIRALVPGAASTNETVAPVGVLLTQAIKPQYPRRDQILRWKKPNRQTQ
jgi:hypothetical protein